MSLWWLQLFCLGLEFLKDGNDKGQPLGHSCHWLCFPMWMNKKHIQGNLVTQEVVFSVANMYWSGKLVQQAACWHHIQLFKMDVWITLIVWLLLSFLFLPLKTPLDVNGKKLVCQRYEWRKVRTILLWGSSSRGSTSTSQRCFRRLSCYKQ